LYEYIIILASELSELGDGALKIFLVTSLCVAVVAGCDTSPPDTPAADAGFEAGAHLTIEYDGNYPTAVTLEQMHKELYFQSAVQIALWGQPLVAVGVAKAGMEDAGILNTSISIAEQRASSDNVIYTANQETVYAYGFTEIGDEPMVFDIAPNTLGFLADAWQRPIEDVGITGPDKGEGGKYIMLPPGYDGETPEVGEGIFVFESPTKTIFWLQRAFVTSDQTEEDAVNILKASSRIYPLSEGAPTEPHFVNQSTTPFYAVTRNDSMNFWYMLDTMIQLEPVQERDLAMMGLAKTVGIQKGENFAPTEEQQVVLLRAVETAKAMMLAVGFDAQGNIKTWKGREWESAFQTQSPYFDGLGHTETHERAAFTYQAMTGAKSMVAKMVGQGSQYQLASKDEAGEFLSGANTYKLVVPANVPINNYWSIAVYDTETRALIANGTPKSSTGSHLDIDLNDDGSVDLFFGPEKPEGVNEANFVLTKSGEGWFAYFRFYGPLDAYFDKTWVPNDFENISS